MPEPVGANALTYVKIPQETSADGLKTAEFKVKGFGFKKHTYKVSFNLETHDFFVQRKKWLGSGWKDQVRVDYANDDKHRTSRWLVRTFIAQSEIVTDAQKAKILNGVDRSVVNDILNRMPSYYGDIDDAGYLGRTLDSQSELASIMRLLIKREQTQSYEAVIQVGPNTERTVRQSASHLSQVSHTQPSPKELNPPRKTSTPSSASSPVAIHRRVTAKTGRESPSFKTPPQWGNNFSTSSEASTLVASNQSSLQSQRQQIASSVEFRTENRAGVTDEVIPDFSKMTGSDLAYKYNTNEMSRVEVQQTLKDSQSDEIKKDFWKHLEPEHFSECMTKCEPQKGDFDGLPLNKAVIVIERTCQEKPYDVLGKMSDLYLEQQITEDKSTDFESTKQLFLIDSAFVSKIPLALQASFLTSCLKEQKSAYDAKVSVMLSQLYPSWAPELQWQFLEDNTECTRLISLMKYIDIVTPSMFVYIQENVPQNIDVKRFALAVLNVDPDLNCFTAYPQLALKVMKGLSLKQMNLFRRLTAENDGVRRVLNSLELNEFIDYLNSIQNEILKTESMKALDSDKRITVLGELESRRENITPYFELLSAPTLVEHSQDVQQHINPDIAEQIKSKFQSGQTGDAIREFESLTKDLKRDFLIWQNSDGVMGQVFAAAITDESEQVDIILYIYEESPQTAIDLIGAPYIENNVKFKCWATNEMFRAKCAEDSRSESLAERYLLSVLCSSQQAPVVTQSSTLPSPSTSNKLGEMFQALNSGNTFAIQSSDLEQLSIPDKVQLLGHLCMNQSDEKFYQLESNEQTRWLKALAKDISDSARLPTQINKILATLDKDDVTMAVWKSNQTLMNTASELFKDKYDGLMMGVLTEAEIESTSNNQTLPPAASSATVNRNPVDVPKGYKYHKIFGDGACFFRGVLAIQTKDTSWIDPDNSVRRKTTEAVFNELESKQMLGIIKQSIREALNGAERICGFLVRVALLNGMSGDFDGIAELIFSKCVTKSGFNLFEAEGLEKAYEGQTLDEDESYSKNELFKYLPDAIGEKLFFNFGMHSKQTTAVQKNQPCLVKPNDGHIDMIAPDDFF
ncbi:hypothetical protein JQC92_12695 [Shewanella sp. 202IG2-18]|uniref:hypothetical protein n=1 Tax=Parashewanella hymeniacidonis TaxID=2807618 RepID=UPI001960B0A7|nr:hypothetical protein [Parashewanella hymeniacidonis]MBM7072879.1 hypothetical protein [Parashewanella hymeniacidonis]